jgi:hypothetical protein
MGSVIATLAASHGPGADPQEIPMRRPVLSLVLGALLVLVAAIPALAADQDMCASGSAFGAMHAEHARAGMLDGSMNPGMHQGYSVCLP